MDRSAVVGIIISLGSPKVINELILNLRLSLDRRGERAWMVRSNPVVVSLIWGADDRAMSITVPRYLYEETMGIPISSATILSS